MPGNFQRTSEIGREKKLFDQLTIRTLQYGYLPLNLVVIDESLFSLSEKYTITDEVLVTSIVTTAGKSGGPGKSNIYVDKNRKYFRGSTIVFPRQLVYERNLCRRKCVRRAIFRKAKLSVNETHE